MAKFHLKDDGTAGPCKAQEGNCPKTGAIHGDSIEDVYSQLEQVMEDQKFYAKSGEAFERGDYMKVGLGGMMMSYEDPKIVEAQVQALRKLGLKDRAVEVLKKYQPVLAAAEEGDQADKIDYEAFHEDGHDYPTGDGFIHRTETWVAKAHYELQTAALYSMMDRLEDGNFDDFDLAAYKVALGDAGDVGVLDGRGKPQSNAFLAFNYNPDRQPDNFWTRATARFKREGFKREVSGGEHRYTVPGYFWRGLPQDARERFALSVVYSSQNSLRSKGNFVTNFLTSRDFPESLRNTFAFNSELSPSVRRDDDGLIETNGRFHDFRVRGALEVDDEGFRWVERERIATSDS